MNIQQEAKEILALHQGNRLGALALVQEQLNTIYARSQVLVSLASVILTVTGFSGRLIAGTSAWAQGFLIAGLVIVLTSAVFIFLRIMTIRWLTKDLGLPLEKHIVSALTTRDRKTKAVREGGMILFLGLSLYLVAVTIMLLNPMPLSVPVR